MIDKTTRETILEDIKNAMPDGKELAKNFDGLMLNFDKAKAISNSLKQFDTKKESD